MDRIINWLLLIIIFVFDPLAISLVVAANFAFDKTYPKRKYKENLYGETIKDNFSEWDNLEDIEVKDAEEIKTQDEFMENLDRIEEQKHWKARQQEIKDWEAAEQRMEIIGQNGNDGEHYDKLDVNKDGVVDKVDKEIAKRRLQEIKNIEKNSPLTQEWKNKLAKEKNSIKGKLDDLTKRY